MAKEHSPAAEQLELSLIADDANDAVRVLRTTGMSGLFNIVAFPLGGLVAEESFSYFDSRNRHHRIGALTDTLMTEFRHSVKKVRARLKLFDDNDRGQEALVSFMATVRAQSRVLFSHPTSGVLQALSGPFRPDLGAFFAGERLVGTSHSSLPTMGVTPELLAGSRPGAFEDFSAFARNFGMALGEHLSKLARILASRGLAVDLSPALRSTAVTITYNDFIGDKFYRRASMTMPGARLDAVAALTLCAAQANASLEVFPAVLKPESSLLLRVQFLTAFHGTSALRHCVHPLPSWLPPHAGQGFELPRLRNLLAHYELRDAECFAVGAEQPLMAAIKGVSKMEPEHVRAQVTERLNLISEFLSRGLTKAQLRPFRALLGSHS